MAFKFDPLLNKIVDTSKQFLKDAGKSVIDASIRAKGNTLNMIGNAVSDEFLFDPVTKRVLPRSQLYPENFNPESMLMMMSSGPVSMGGKSKELVEKTVSKLFNAEEGATKQLTSGAKQLPAYKFDPITNKVQPSTPQGVSPIPPKVAKTITDVDSVINMKRDVPIKDIHGQKATLPAGEAYTAYNTSDNKIVLKDGETYVVNKNQFQNVKGNALKSGPPTEFAPELKGTEETIHGSPSQSEIDTLLNDEAGQGMTRQDALEYLKNNEQ